MPTITPRGESGGLAGPRRAHGIVSCEPGRVAVTADPGFALVRREPPTPAWPMPNGMPPVIALATRQPPTARECGLGEVEETTGGTRCHDIMPELMIVLI